MSEKILIVMGEGDTVAGAIISLQERLNDMAATYDYINPMVITIDRDSSPVHCSVRVYAAQMLKRKGTF